MASVDSSPPPDSTPACRSCGAALRHTFVDLGLSPLCQTQIAPSQLNRMERFFPLHTYVCSECFLVQLEEYVSPDEIFSAEYPYYSSYSKSWIAHARDYVEHVQKDFAVGEDDLVVEIASNDGYLLQHFVERKVRCLGVEPAQGVAEAARLKGVRTVIRFFGQETARDLLAAEGPARLVLGNNVLAHVPDVNDFVAGVELLLDERGFATFEFPHLMRLVASNQFDTIYHEHFSYFSLIAVRRIFENNGLSVFDVRELDTHGGSIRVYVCRPGVYDVNASVSNLEQRERDAGYAKLSTYFGFADKVRETKRRLLTFLVAAKDAGKHVVGYGAPGKGNTLLNYCGIREDFIDYTVDLNPHKQGTFTPGTRIPIYNPSRIFETRPDYVLILAWNLAKEISQQMARIGEWGGRFVVPIPEVRVLD
jgi:C-methyltransferase C-terminal domain/Putative zinc binding domain/Methyltransferase domain